MESEIVNMKNKRIERSIVSISAKVADAVEMMQRANALSTKSEARLIEAGLELEELYTSLDCDSQKS